MSESRFGILVRCMVSLLLVTAADGRSPTNTAAQALKGLPFTLDWVQGRCSNCQTAKSLSDVQFVDRTDAWAIGFLPPGQTGVGDYSVLHTRDGGRTWTEIPEPWQHNEAPTVSFANGREGWLRDADMAAAEDRLLLTRDGGRHWRRLPMRDPSVSDVQYLGRGLGFGDGFDIHARQGYLIATRDSGWHWSKSPLPKGFSGEWMDFIDDRRGFIAGCLERQQMTVIATSDGGAHWKTSAMDLPRLDSKTSQYCVFEPDGLDFVDARHGWLLTSRHSFGPHEDDGLTVVWATIDGGANWKAVLRDGYSPRREWFGGLRFVDDMRGFVWKRETIGDRTTGILLYTTDGGRDWSRLELPRAVSTCRPYDGDLECAAGGNGYWVLRIRPARAGFAFRGAPQ